MLKSGAAKAPPAVAVATPLTWVSKSMVPGYGLGSGFSLKNEGSWEHKSKNLCLES